MTLFFEKALPSMRAAAIKDLRLAVRDVTTEFTRSGSNGLSNSRYPIYVQEECFKAVPGFARQLIERLECFGPDDRFTDAKDYDTAAKAVRDFSSEVSQIYQDIRKQGEPFGDRRPDLDADKMRAAVESAVNDIAEHKAVHLRRRSFWTWFKADVKKVGIVSTLVAVGAGVLGAFLKGWLVP